MTLFKSRSFEEDNKMARRSIPIEEKIAKQQEVVNKAKARYDAAAAELEKLKKQKSSKQVKELESAIMKSGKSYDEIISFLQK